jgi:putative ABC transport system substrate-binding protein
MERRTFIKLIGIKLIGGAVPHEARRIEANVSRRAVIAMLGGLALASPRTPFAQSAARPPLIGYLAAPTRSGSGPVIAAFLDGLRELGYVEGLSYTMAYRFADEHVDRLPALARELVELHPNLIVAGGTISTVAAKEATPTIPIICPQISDAMRLGLAQSHARPGENITGLLSSVEGLPAKQIEVAREIVPDARLIGLLVNVGDRATSPVQQQEIEAASRSVSVAVVPAEVREPQEIEDGLKRLLSAGVHVVIVLRDSMFFSERRRIADIALASHLPTVFPFREPVEAGGLIGYGVNIAANFRRAAVYVDKILNGARPEDLPLEFATKLELVINLKTAKTLGLAVAPSLLARADEVIE